MAEKKPEKKATEYVVLRGDDAAGPFSVVGNYLAQGQTAAKRLAVIAEKERDTDPESDFFIAVPASSFVPEKPVAKWVITFEGADGSEHVEADDDDDAADQNGTGEASEAEAATLAAVAADPDPDEFPPTLED